MKDVSKKQLNKCSKFIRKDKSRKAAAAYTPSKAFRQVYNKRYRCKAKSIVVSNTSGFMELVFPLAKKSVKWEWW